MMDASKYYVDEKLRDGTVVVLRAMRKDDRAGFEKAFKEFAESPASVRLRFHGVKKSLSEREAIAATDVDFKEHVTLVVTLSGSDDSQIGAARYILAGAGPKAHRAEIAFAVLEQYQGKGIGSLLLRHLAIIGRGQGVQEFQADVLVENRTMLGVFERSGFPLQRSTELGVERVLLDIAD